MMNYLNYVSPHKSNERVAPFHWLSTKEILHLVIWLYIQLKHHLLYVIRPICANSVEKSMSKRIKKKKKYSSQLESELYLL